MTTHSDASAPTFGPIRITQVTDEELLHFADLIYRRTGIHIAPQKKLLLSNRLRRRLKQTGIEHFGDYYKHIRKLRDDDPEWDALLQEVTTHETYMFRDDQQWDWLRNVYLPQRAEEARQGKRPRSLRIWSAACSTGDEPTTFACCIAASLPELSKWKVQILGTDIGTGALEQAKAGEYGQRSMRLVPDEYKRRFFSKSKDGHTWQAMPILTDMMAFRQHNLMEPLCERPFDLVLLKNVLIYFDAKSKTTVLHNVRAAMVRGGMLMAGSTEGVADLLRDFRRLEPWLFQKPIS